MCDGGMHVCMQSFMQECSCVCLCIVRVCGEMHVYAGLVCKHHRLLGDGVP